MRGEDVYTGERVEVFGNLGRDGEQVYGYGGITGRDKQRCVCVRGRG